MENVITGFEWGLGIALGLLVGTTMFGTLAKIVGSVNNKTPPKPPLAPRRDNTPDGGDGAVQ
jgi:hypothetical protein